MSDKDALAKFANSTFVDGRYGGADAERLSVFERRYNIQLSDAHRRFLMQENGLDYYIPPDIVEALPSEEQRDAFGLTDINTLFGIGNGHTYFDLEKLAPDMGFHDYSFTPFANVIGLGGDHCTLVEITQGKHARKIMYTDGELFRGMPRDIIDGFAVDDAVAYFIEMGYYHLIATDLDNLFARYARLI